MRAASLCSLGVLALACGNARAVPASDVAAPAIGADGALLVDGEVTFAGMCDASGAVELDARTFMIADDEDNVLRVYDAERGGPPLAAVDVSAGVGLVARGKKRPRAPELDLEAATRIGDRAYWLTSHGRDARGRERAERLRLFATTLPARADDVASVAVTGLTDRLIEALLADPRYAALGLAAAAARAPKDEGGLNLEGMTATPRARSCSASATRCRRGARSCSRSRRRRAPSRVTSRSARRYGSTSAATGCAR